MTELDGYDSWRLETPEEERRHLYGCCRHDVMDGFEPEETEIETIEIPDDLNVVMR